MKYVVAGFVGMVVGMMILILGAAWVRRAEGDRPSGALKGPFRDADGDREVSRLRYPWDTRSR